MGEVTRDAGGNIHWVDDGQTAHRPVPDWWDEARLDEVEGVLIYTTHNTDATLNRTVVSDEAELVRISGEMGIDNEDLAEALRVLRGERRGE